MKIFNHRIIKNSATYAKPCFMMLMIEMLIVMMMNLGSFMVIPQALKILMVVITIIFMMIVIMRNLASERFHYDDLGLDNDYYDHDDSDGNNVEKFHTRRFYFESPGLDHVDGHHHGKLTVWHFMVPAKITRESVVTVITQENTGRLQFKIQDFLQLAKLGLWIYNQTAGRRFQRAIQMSGRKHWEIHNLPLPIQKQENEKTIKYKTRFITSESFMARPLSNMNDNLAEGLHKGKYKDCKLSPE